MYWYDFLRIGLVPKYFISNNPLEASESQTKVFTVLKKPIWVQRIMLYAFIDHSIRVGWSDYDNLYWAGVKSMFKVFYFYGSSFENVNPLLSWMTRT